MDRSTSPFEAGGWAIDNIEREPACVGVTLKNGIQINVALRRTVKLTATQERILHAAAGRLSGDIFKGGYHRISAAGFEAVGKAPRSGSYRSGTKQARMIELVRQLEGTSVDEIAREAGWLPYTMRGTMTHALKKRLGMTIVSHEIDGQPRRYRIA